ncbi:MAG: tetratricopeptide repeat protein [Sedimentisphaerales bacterium]|nr:tetratricopeptide repeat protein [Sedimentisphaerales bacterium]
MNGSSKNILLLLLVLLVGALPGWCADGGDVGGAEPQENLNTAAAQENLSPVEAVTRGNELYAEQQYAEALAEYQQDVFGTDPAAEVLYNRANCYYELGDYDHAIELYEQAAVETDSDELAANCRFNLGNANLRQLLESSGQDGQGDMAQTLEGLAEAAGYYRQALELNPDMPGAQNNIAVVRDIMRQIIEQMQQQPPQQQQQDNQEQQEQEDQQDQQQQSGGGQQQDQDQQQDQQQNGQQDQQQDQQQNGQQDQQQQGEQGQQGDEQQQDDQQQSQSSEQQQQDQQQQQQNGQEDQQEQGEQQQQSSGAEDQEQQGAEDQQQQAAEAEEEDNIEDRHDASGISADAVIDEERQRQERRSGTMRDRTVERDW